MQAFFIAINPNKILTSFFILILNYLLIIKGGIFIKTFFLIFYISIFIFIILAGIFSYSSNSFYNQTETSISSNPYFSTSDYFWPLPGFHTITSPFGPRKSPTTGASSNHSGIDISAPEGTIIYSVISGNVIYRDFKGANGHTIIIKNSNLEIQYSHVSPNYIVNLGNYINAGEIIRNSWS
ncbi:MAG: M23 family metallopeptidase [Clostridia bacterium]|nr:M23 family metallopeptidase [Clostridia bacterium]